MAYWGTNFLGLQQLHLGPTPEPDVMPLRGKTEVEGWSPVDIDWAPEKPLSTFMTPARAQARAGCFLVYGGSLRTVRLG